MYIYYTLAHRQDFNAEFMTRNAWIRIKRHFPEETAEIGATNTYAMDAHKDLSGGRRRRLSNFEMAKRQRFFELNSFHFLRGAVGLKSSVVFGQTFTVTKIMHGREDCLHLGK